MVVDEDLDQMKLYIDGVLRATTNKPSNFGAIRNNSNWRVQAGRYNYDGSGAGEVEFPGVLDEIRIVNYARTPQEIADTWFGTTGSNFSRLLNKSKEANSKQTLTKRKKPKPTSTKTT